MGSKQRFTADQVARALTLNHGLVHITAKQLQCDPQTVYNYMKRYATVQAACDNARESMVDTAESKFYDAIQNGEAWALAMMLKTKGKDRGYVEKRELDVDGGIRIYRGPAKAATSADWQAEVAQNGFGS